LSIDILLGACAGMLFFDRLIEAELNLIVYLLLGLAVWCIYTFDHLLDAKQIGKHASTLRHSFHQKFFNTLSISLVLVGSIGLILALNLLKLIDIIILGLGMGTFILLFFILLKLSPQKFVLLKEISIATLYVGGIMLAPFFHNDLEEVPAYFWMLGIAYVLVAWFNTIYLGILDNETDQKDGLSSLALRIGVSRSRTILYVLLTIMLSYIISLLFLMSSFSYVYLTFILIIALIHRITFLQRSKDKVGSLRKKGARFMLPFL